MEEYHDHRHSQHGGLEDEAALPKKTNHFIPFFHWHSGRHHVYIWSIDVIGKPTKRLCSMQNDQTQPYRKFASVYDQMGADEHSRRMTEYCFKLFQKFDIHPVTGLDLCCGTGTAVKLFSERGILMSGLDRSAQMLAVAAKKLKGHKSTLYQKELPTFRLLDPKDSRKVRQFDLITSFYDSLNYLTTQKDLKAAFRSVNQHLTPGGWFIFDMNTDEALKIIWDSQVFAEARESLAWIWKNEYHPKTSSATCTTTFFRPKGKLWERFEEVHVEKAYPNSVIRKLLTASGFIVKGFYRCFTFDKPAKSTYRICVVAMKRPARSRPKRA